VCRGPYAPALLNAWTKFDEERLSENEDPAGFQEDQLYIVFACADGGVDLEHIQLNSAAEASAMLLQVGLHSLPGVRLVTWIICMTDLSGLYLG
jgi:serine/threonine-protein kinase haspin